MKSKLVLWGIDAEDKRVLIAMELVVEANKVKIWTFPDGVGSDEFYDQLMKDWRNDVEIPFPEGYSLVEKELSVTESLLDESIKVERTDIIMRAQTEWHFIVLSHKMKAMFESELSDLQARIKKLESFDDHVWEELKTYWGKVQQQVRERNLFKEHADILRENTNELFAEMKTLRSKMDEEFKHASKEVHDKFEQTIATIEEKMEKGGARLQSLFEELKQVQREFKHAEMSKDHRSSVWERLDAAFKAVKVKRFGDKAGQDANPSDRVQRRLAGLLNAIDKMDKSIKRDVDDLNFQKKKVDTSEGQLEAQIRQAKILMIEERIRSKEEKLGEMRATQADLEKRIEKFEAKEASRMEKEKIEAAKAAAKEKIAAEIQHAAEAREEDAEVFEKAAEALTEEPKPEKDAPAGKEESMLAAVGTTLGESMEDAVDTMKAIASVLGGKIGKVVEEMKEKGEKFADEAEDKLDALKDKLEDKAEEWEDKAEELAEKMGKKIKDAKKAVEEKADELEDKVEELVNGEKEESARED